MKARKPKKRGKRPGIMVYCSEDDKKRIGRVCRLTGRSASAFAREAMFKLLASEEKSLKDQLGL